MRRFAYALARRISAERIFKRRYKMSYRWFVESEHIDRPNEIVENASVISISFEADTFHWTFLWRA